MTVAPYANGPNPEITNIWPKPRAVSDDLPIRAREYLTQAVFSPRAPSGAIMLTASAIDSMLKDKGYKEGNLYSRIEQAEADHLITKEMALWAHEVRLDANDERHAEDGAKMPTGAESEKAIEFAVALGDFLYVLPAMVKRGRKSDAA